MQAERINTYGKNSPAASSGGYDESIFIKSSPGAFAPIKNISYIMPTIKGTEMLFSKKARDRERLKKAKD